MKLSARSDNRRSESVNARSGTTVTMPLNAMSPFRRQSCAVRWLAPMAER
jgi:hypothetical protein